jgi:taurine dioxygenase
MTFETRPLGSALGVEIAGVDLSRPLGDDVMARIRDVWHEHALVLFREQSITAEDQKRFTRFFGEFQTPHAGAQMGSETLVIGNVTVDGVAGELPTGDMQFHQDRCYSERPTLASILYGIEIPSAGGNTKWASMYRAYDRLPAALKERIAGLHVRFVFDYSEYDAAKPNAWENAPHFVQPLVIAHPETGRPALFCNRLMADALVELPRDAGRALIEELCVAVEAPDNVYEHVWRAGDVVMWDNLATAHARTDFDPSERRYMRRTTVKGPALVAYAGCNVEAAGRV